MPSVFSVKAAGLATQPNQLDVPDGALTIAKNVVINRDNVVESRRGFKLYGDALGTASDRAKQLINYKERILRHFDNILQYDKGNGEFESFAGNYSEASEGSRIKSIEANGNLYFTTSDGIMKISARTADDFSTSNEFITSAGVVKAVDASASLKYNYGDQASFFTQDSAVAYRVVWGYKDLNTNLFLGTPSQRLEVYNPMLTLMLQDYMVLLGALDNIGGLGSLINDQNYVNTLKLDITAAADTLRNNLIDLAEKLDKDILYADNYYDRGDYDAATNSPILFNKAKSLGEWNASTNIPPLFDGAADLGEWDASTNTPLLFDQVTNFGDWYASSNLNPPLFDTVTNLGNWNANTNTPTLNTGVGNIGDVYAVSTGGSQDFGEGTITFSPGDYVYFNGQFWRKSAAALHVGTAGDYYEINGVGTQNFGNGPISFNGSGYVYYTGTHWQRSAVQLAAPTKGAYYQVTNGGTVDFGDGPIIFLSGEYVYYNGSKWRKYTDSLAHQEGDFYQVSVAGSVDFGGGSISFNQGDYAYYNGSEWAKSTSTLNNNNPGDYFEVDVAGVQDFRTDTTSAFISDEGNWDADTNTPTLADGVGIIGDFYEVTVPGTQNLGSGNITFAVGDFVYYDGSVWVKSTDAIRLIVGDYIYFNGSEWEKTTTAQFTDAPLEIGTVEIETGVCTITFTAGDPSDFFTTGSKISLEGFTAENDPNEEFTKGITISVVSDTTIKFNTTASGEVTLTSDANITSYDFRGIPEPVEPEIPATHGELVEIQDYMSFIIDQLKLQSSEVIPTVVAEEYISPLDITTTSTVLLNITIPAEITSDYFFQVYRSQVFTADDTAVLSTDVFPNDELQLVYEAYPTEEQRDQGFVIVEDIVPDDFRGANLYTNASTGEGILQANDVPPFAKDINVFKNSVFYANTRTRHRKEISLLGVQQMIEDYNNGIIPQITIASNNKFHTYQFILGEAEQFEVITTDAASLNTSGTASYFEVNSGNDVRQHYFWYKQGTVTDPAITDKIGHVILLDGTESAAEIAEKTRNALNVVNQDFAAVNDDDELTVSTVDVGYTTDPDFSNTPFTLTILNQGQGEKVTQQKELIETTADTAGSLAGKYFLLNSTYNRKRYYVWFKVNNTGTDPEIAGATGIEVALDTNATADEVAEAIEAELADLTELFEVERNNDELTITNVQFGPSIGAIDGDSGFTFSVIQEGMLHVLLSGDVSPARAVTITSNSLTRVINQNDSESIYSFYTSGAFEVPGKMVFEARGLREGQFYLTSNNAVTGDSFSPSIAPVTMISSIDAGDEDTMLITTSTPHGLDNLDTIVISSSNSTPSIDGYHQITLVSPTTFRVPVYVTVAGTLGSVSKSNMLESSSNEEAPNRVYYSKMQQPESVPILNYFDVGAKDKAILRIYPLRDSLFVLKEDGLYRISGEAIPFNLGLFDSSCICVAADSVSSMDNVIYAWTRQGVSSITESGVRNISRPIDVTLLPLSSTNYPAFSTATWGIGYESDKSYTVFTVSRQSDTAATIGYKYNALTNSWTTIQKDYVCGVIETATDIMYVGAGDTNFIEQERKTFTREDYADREYEFAIQTDRYRNKIISLDTVANIEPFDVFVQNQTVTIYEFNSLLKKLDLDPGTSSSDYFSTLAQTPGANLRSALIDLAEKLDTDNLGHTNYEESIEDITGTITNIAAGSPSVITCANHGLKTGRKILISSANATPSINGEHIVTVIDANRFSIEASVINPGNSGFFTTLNNDFQDLKTCYNVIIGLLNTDSVVGFSNYRENSIITKQEILVTAVDRVAKRITVAAELDFVVGDFTIFKSIDCEIQYSPNTFGGDPISLKHMREAQLMFESLAFTRGTVSFATDLLPKFEPVPFDADGNGRFGFTAFGEGFFGGASNSAPIRTYIPRNCQRCRYMVIKFNHRVAREKWSLFGITITGETELSTRTYR